MDRLTGLTVFVQVAERGGFSAAARRLNMSTTMVSAHVQALEDRLGVRLLHRTTRKVSLTDAGRTYYDRCLQILQELEEADSLAGALQATPRGTLRLYTNGSLVEYLSALVSEFLGQYPEAAVDMIVGERLVDMVEEGIDLIIRSVPLPESSLIVRRLSGWQHILCCSAAYLVSHPAPRHPQDIAGHNCLQYNFYPFGNEWRFIGMQGEILSVHVSGNFRTHSAASLHYMALAGRGLFLAPSYLIANDLRDGRLVRLLPDYPPPQYQISAAYPHRRHVPAKVRVFIDMAARRFAEQQNAMIPITS